jgi:hypothetical protein
MITEASIGRKSAARKSALSDDTNKSDKLTISPILNQEFLTTRDGSQEAGARISENFHSFVFLGALPADRFFVFGLRGRQAVTCEPHQAA